MAGEECRALALREEDHDSPSVCSQRSADRSQVEGLLPPSPQGQRSSLLHYPPHILNRINHLHDKQLFLPLWGFSAVIDGAGRCMLGTIQAREPGPHSLRSALPVTSTVGTEKW